MAAFTMRAMARTCSYERDCRPERLPPANDESHGWSCSIPQADAGRRRDPGVVRATIEINHIDFDDARGVIVANTSGEHPLSSTVTRLPEAGHVPVNAPPIALVHAKPSRAREQQTLSMHL